MKRTYATRHDVLGPDSKSDKSRGKDKPKPKPKEKEGHRETVEAIVVAFILALLVRGFEAEAFVIPTGSMAPTLMGRHKEITCPQCGYTYAVNASVEDDGSRSLGIGRFRINGNPNVRPTQVVAGTCVNCRFQAAVADAPTFNGDRILVMKFLYDMPFLPGTRGGPQRWDVVVFRYPEEPEVSYIKRLIGLPGEEIRIGSGDIYVKRPGAGVPPGAEAVPAPGGDGDDGLRRSTPRRLVEGPARVAAVVGLEAGVVDRGAVGHVRRRGPAGSAGRAALSPPLARPRAVGRDLQRPRAAPAAAPHADH